MWRALELVAPRVKPDGTLFIALYNDQGWVSRYWLAVKRLYHGSLAGRILMIVGHAPYLLFGRIAVRALSGRLREARGMSLWYDMFDWLGGYPFEVVGPGQVLSFFDARGFKTRTVHAVGRRHGCNEYVFQRVPV
jgi:2-polyprenyl-6-hydroxyphenyl methylase/3-demethylubiquinone-9 3-methyltransferase